MELCVVETEVFLFYNIRSGSRQGRHLKSIKEQHFRIKDRLNVRIQMYDVLNSTEKELGLKHISQEYSNATSSCIHIMVAGGDGTLAGILNDLLRRDIPIFEARFLFSLFPFGNGNDCSQALGWGRTVKYKHTKSTDRLIKLITERLDAKISHLDLWRVHVKADDIIITNRPPVQEYNRLMTNYMTLGMQGKVGIGFEQHRHKTRAFNIIEYTWQSIIKGIVKPAERIQDYFDNLVNDGVTYGIRESSKYNRCVEILFQNIPGIWGRQIDLWTVCRKKAALMPQSGSANPPNWHKGNIDDGLLEIFAIKSRIDYLLKQMPCTRTYHSLATFGQFGGKSSITFLENSRAHLMIDGEFLRLEHPKSLSISPLGRIKVTQK